MTENKGNGFWAFLTLALVGGGVYYITRKSPTLQLIPEQIIGRQIRASDTIPCRLHLNPPTPQEDCTGFIVIVEPRSERLTFTIQQLGEQQVFSAVTSLLDSNIILVPPGHYHLEHIYFDDPTMMVDFTRSNPDVNVLPGQFSQVFLRST